MSNLPAGAQGQPLFTVVAGAVYYSTDGGVTWTEAQAPGSPSNSSAPISGDGTVGTPFTIAAGAIALTKLHTQADSTVVGVPAGGGTESPIALTQAQLTALINPATSSLPGAMPAAQAAALVSGLSAGVFVSSVIDFTTVADNIQYGSVALSNAGHFFLGIRYALLVSTLTGTASGSSVYCVGNDSGHQNIISQAQGTTTSGSLNALTGALAPPVIPSFNNAGGIGTLLDTATPIVIKVVTAPTGVTAMTGRIVMYGTWL